MELANLAVNKLIAENMQNIFLLYLDILASYNIT